MSIDFSDQQQHGFSSLRIMGCEVGGFRGDDGWWVGGGCGCGCGCGTVQCRETFFLLARSIQETSRVPVARELRSMLCGCTPAPLTRKHEAHVECGVLEAELHLSFYSERLKNYISKFF
jgi:hypothetical protein